MHATKDNVFRVCKELSKSGIFPTITEVRLELGNQGSRASILKYLTEWKKIIIRRGLENSENPEFDLGAHNLNSKMQSQNELLSKELIRAEHENFELKEQNADLKREFDLLNQHYQKLQREIETTKSELNDLREERGSILKESDLQKDKQIERLENELHEVHKVSIKQISELGQRADEKLIEQKVKVINLEEKNDQLQKETKKINHELRTAQGALKPIKDELLRLRKLVQEVVSFEQLQEYERKNIERTLGVDND